MSNEKDHKEYSRLDKHLGLLGLEDVPSDQLEAERQLVEGLHLPPLDLQEFERVPERDTAAWWKGKQWQTGLALVAALALMVIVGRLSYDPAGPIRSKGLGTFHVWYQRGEEPKKLGAEEVLQSGDKFRVEVTASQPTQAYLIVMDNLTRNAQLGQNVLDEALQLEAGDTAAFEQTFVLTEPNLNETVFVVLCEADLIAQTSATRTRELLWQAIQGDKVPGCSVKQRVLR